MKRGEKLKLLSYVREGVIGVGAIERENESNALYMFVTDRTRTQSLTDSSRLGKGIPLNDTHPV